MTHLSFIVPLAARQSVENWTLVSRLCALTIQSCLAQTHADISVELCCHDVPDIVSRINDARLFIHRASFDPPSRAGFTTNGMTDKWRKVAMGLVAVRNKGSSWLMIVDADDLVSSALSRFLLKQSSAHGFAIKTGYRYGIGGRLIHLDTSFNCGTNAIIRSDRVRLPQSLDEQEIKQCLMLTAGHTIIESSMEAQSTPLTPLPFPGAVYVQHASQHSVAVWPERRPMWRRSIREHMGALRRLRLANLVLPRGFGVTMADITLLGESRSGRTS